jgi:hypothetical protein
MIFNNLRDLVLLLPRQVEQVVHPVGGGSLVHRAPDKGLGLSKKENYCY